MRHVALEVPAGIERAEQASRSREQNAETAHHCDFSRSLGAESATTRQMRGLIAEAIRLMTPPLPENSERQPVCRRRRSAAGAPAASRPSKRMQILSPLTFTYSCVRSKSGLRKQVDEQRAPRARLQLHQLYAELRQRVLIDKVAPRPPRRLLERLSGHFQLHAEDASAPARERRRPWALRTAASGRTGRRAAQRRRARQTRLRRRVQISGRLRGSSAGCAPSLQSLYSRSVSSGPPRSVAQTT